MKARFMRGLVFGQLRSAKSAAQQQGDLIVSALENPWNVRHVSLGRR
jgi:hypothetical protein